MKTSWVRRLKESLKINFVGIQETWMFDSKCINIRGCWDSADFDYEGIDSHGRSHGLLCI